MRRYAVAERVQQIAELFLCLCLAKSQHLKHLSLNCSVVNSDRTAAKLGTVQNDVVCLGADSAGIAVQILQVLIHGRGKGMVHRVESSVLLAVLEKWELGNPQELEIHGIENSLSLGALATQSAQGIENHLVFIGNDQDQVACFGAHCRLDRLIFFLGQELGVGGRDLARLRPLEPSKSLCLVGLDELYQRINLLTGEAGAALDIDGTYGTAVLHRTREHLEAAILHYLGEIGQLISKANVGLVRAEALHCLGIGHTNEVLGKLLAAKFFQQLFQEALVHLHYVICRYEGHLGINLGKLGLTVSTQILVAIATGDLEITVEAGHHQQLLVQLRRLGQCVKFALMHTGGHQIISRSLGSGLAQVGGFNVDKAIFGIVISRDLGNAGARHNAALHVGTAKIQITVLQAELRVDLAILHNLEGRGLRNRKNAKIVYGDLDLTRGKIGVYCSLAAATNHALGTENELRAHAKCRAKDLSVGLFVKCQLNDACTVTQVNKDQRAQISLLLRPSHHAYSLTHVLGGKRSAIMGPLVVFSQQFCHNSMISFLFILRYCPCGQTKEAFPDKSDPLLPVRRPRRGLPFCRRSLRPPSPPKTQWRAETLPWKLRHPRSKSFCRASNGHPLRPDTRSAFFRW